MDHLQVAFGDALGADGRTCDYLPGWIPSYNLNLSDDVIGYAGAPAIALDYP
jgi:hypothetical protein